MEQQSNDPERRKYLIETQLTFRACQAESDDEKENGGVGDEGELQNSSSIGLVHVFPRGTFWLHRIIISYRPFGVVKRGMENIKRILTAHKFKFANSFEFTI